MAVFLLASALLLPGGDGTITEATPQALLLRMMDSEALYTLRGRIKPLSEGFWQDRYPADQPQPARFARVQAVLRQHLPEDVYQSGLLVFDRVHDGHRHATAFVAHRPLVRGTVLQHPKAFAAIGADWTMEPQEIFERADRAKPADRWRAFGLLFGYPTEAVEFFVQAGLSELATGKFVERDFRHIPTFAAAEGRFVYAVPKHAPISWEDRELRRRAHIVLAEYGFIRAACVGNNRENVTGLLACLIAEEVVAYSKPVCECLRSAAGRCPRSLPRARHRQ